MSDPQPVPVPAAGRGANLLAVLGEVHPEADASAPPDHRHVRMANATHGASQPGEVVVLPIEEAQAVCRSGYGQEVLANGR